jgi:CBS domain-containing protein
MNILELCDAEVPWVSVEASVGDAIRVMSGLHVGAVAVADAEQRVAGIFTERDVLKKVALSGQDPDHTRIGALMTTPVEMATTRTTPGEALAIMLERHYRHLPIIDEHGRLLGMLSIRNVLQWRVDDLARELDAAVRSKGAA